MLFHILLGYIVACMIVNTMTLPIKGDKIADFDKYFADLVCTHH